MEMHSFRKFRANSPLALGLELPSGESPKTVETAFPQNFHTRKLDEISVLYEVLNEKM